MSGVKLNSPLHVKYRNEIFDITNFVKHHPGGINTLINENNKDISYKLHNLPPHSDAAFYLLNDYKLKEPSSILNDSADKTKNGLRDTNNNNENSLEKLIDWTKPMISQIPNLKSKYAIWVNKPIDRPLRLFDSNWLELLTKTPWWTIPLFWLPIICYLNLIGIEEGYRDKFSNNSMIFSFANGILLWTFLEYTLHRWLFHLNPNNFGPNLCVLHFLLHGLHHKVPFDPYRLVFPPIPAVILATICYQPIPLIYNCPKIVLSGALFGYLCYDMIHYYIHYGSPSIGYLYNLKRYHYQHHFVHHDKGFGISSPLWDIVFGTKIILRKLKYLLKW